MLDRKNWDITPLPEGKPSDVQNEQLSCSHKFVHLKETKSRTGGGYNDKFTLINYFFCEKCLEEKEVKKEEYSRDTPLWFY